VPDTDPRQAPSTVPVALGLAGLLPFLAAAAGALALGGAGAGVAATGAALYGAVILSFLGGVHWGTGLRDGGGAGPFLWGVTPSLVAFLAAFLPLPWMLAVLSAGFVVAGAVDVAAFSRTGPRWYVRLRIALTLVVVTALALTASAAPHAPLLDVAPLLSGAH